MVDTRRVHILQAAQRVEEQRYDVRLGEELGQLEELLEVLVRGLPSEKVIGRPGAVWGLLRFHALSYCCCGTLERWGRLGGTPLL